MKLTATQLGLALIPLNAKYRLKFLQSIATEAKESRGQLLFRIPLKDGSDRWIRAFNH